MPIRVQTPDNKIAEFPDGTDPKTIESALQKQFSPQPAAAPQRPGFMDRLISGPPRTGFDKFTAETAPYMAIPGGIVGQTVGSAALGAGEAAAKGEPIAPGAGKAAAGSLIGRGVGALAGRGLQSITPLVQKLEQSRVGQQIGQALPEMGTKGSELFKLVREGGGTTIRTKMLGDAIDTVEKTVGPRTTLAVPSLSPDKLTVRELVDKLEKMGEKAYPGTTKTLSLSDKSAVKEARRVYGAAREEIVKSLDFVQKGAGTVFDKAYERAAAQGAYLEIMDKALDKNGKLDTGKAMEVINKSPSTWKRRLGPYWDQVKDVLTRGQGTPAKVDQPLHAASPRSWAHGLLKGRYQAGGGQSQPLSPELVQGALASLGAANPELASAAALGAAEGSKHLIPGMGRRGE